MKEKQLQFTEQAAKLTAQRKADVAIKKAAKMHKIGQAMVLESILSLNN